MIRYGPWAGNNDMWKVKQASASREKNINAEPKGTGNLRGNTPEKSGD